MRKKFVWIGGGILVVLILLVIILSLFASSIVESKARAYLAKNPPKGFVIDFEKISVRLWSRTIKVKEISFMSSTDSISAHMPGKEPMNIRIESIKLSGIGLMRAWKGEHFKINKIEVINPRSSLLTEGSVFNVKESIEKGHEARVDSTRPKPFHSIRIGEILVKGGELAISDSASSLNLLTTSDLFVEVKDVYVDSTLKYFEASEIDIDIKDSEIILPGDLYQMKFARMQIAKHDSSIFIDSLQLIPLVERYKFAVVYGKQTDVFTVGMNSIRVNGIFFDSLLMIQKPIVRIVELNDVQAEIFRDKNRPFDFSNHPKLPHQALRTMKKDLTVEEVKINNGFVKYIEHEAGADKPGIVFFEQINAAITNITSDSLRIIDHPTLAVNATAMLYGKGQLEANIQMRLNDPNDKLILKAHLGKMEAGEANRMIEPGTLVNISEGTIDDITLTGNANRYVGKGTMTMKYNGLKIDVLKEKKDGEVKRRWFVSTLATEIVKSANPDHKKHLRVSPMHFDRDMNKGIINFLWKTCFSGIKETLLPSKQKDNSKKHKNK